MTNEQYNELNDYLNKFFLDKNNILNPIFCDYLKELTIATMLINDFARNEVKNFYINNKEITLNNTLEYVEKLINEFFPEYSDDWKQSFNSGVLDISYAEEHKYSDSYYRKENGNDLLNINLDGNYNDIKTIIHEFTHYVCFKNKLKSYNADFLSEFFAIYYEMEAIKNMKNNNMDCSFLYRIGSFINKNYDIGNYIFILLCYEKLGNINEHTENDIITFFGLKDTIFKKECKKLLNNFKKDYDETSEILSTQYRYLIGTLLATYASVHIDRDKIKYLLYHINDHEYATSSIEEILEEIGIEINVDALNESLNILKERIRSEQNDNSNNRSYGSR